MIKASVDSNFKKAVDIKVEGEDDQIFMELNLLILSIVKEKPDLLHYIKDSINTIDDAIKSGIDNDIVTKFFMESYFIAIKELKEGK